MLWDPCLCTLEVIVDSATCNNWVPPPFHLQPSLLMGLGTGTEKCCVISRSYGQSTALRQRIWLCKQTLLIKRYQQVATKSSRYMVYLVNQRARVKMDLGDPCPVWHSGCWPAYPLPAVSSFRNPLGSNNPWWLAWPFSWLTFSLPGLWEERKCPETSWCTSLSLLLEKNISPISCSRAFI